MRSFIALPLPPEASSVLAAWSLQYRKSLETVLEAGFPKDSRPRLSWTAPESYHLTLAFLGDIEGKALELAQEALEAAQGFKRFTFTLKAPEGFAGRGGLRVIFAKLIDGEASQLLYKAVNSRLSEAARLAKLVPLCADWERGRPFAPHITLARVKAEQGLAKGIAMDAARDMERLKGSWAIESCVLFKSELSRAGSVYTKMKSIALR